MNDISCKLKTNLLFLLLLIPFFANCKSNSEVIYTNATSNSTINQGIKMLSEFYLTFYGNEYTDNNEQLKRKYISQPLLNKIDSLSNDEDLILDYDPFIQSQDYSEDVLKKTLKIEPLTKTNEYRVSFLLFGEKDEKRTYIDILLEQTSNGDFLIDSILNDNNLNLKNNK
ncbi:DUF3828 domain-containing protein [uncultured Gilliamella sp.]|uniref:DUF3828 domain-containing protein n=1 Tax=uncultured Gilliamella sp. TaxID=1193505 RepID=UPI0025F8857B|nr:DUF3828 domain-containing protein [uncultured Gilliamella sp.]